MKNERLDLTSSIKKVFPKVLSPEESSSLKDHEGICF